MSQQTHESRRGRQPEQVVLAEVVRSGFVEGHHRGSVVAVDPVGEVLFAHGDTTSPIFPRSCNKPLQATAMVRLGLDLPPELLALACASHSGEPFHVEGVRRILAGAGLDESALQTPPDWPLDDVEREAAIRGGGQRSAVLMNCSGKHAAMLATCVLRGWDLSTYTEPTHPLQAAIAVTFAELTGEAVAAVGVDGCGAPLFATSLRGLARAFGQVQTAADGTAEARVAAAIRAHPEHVSGSTRDEARLLRALPGTHRQGGCGGVLRGRPAGRHRGRAQDRRRRVAGPAGGDGRGAARARRRPPGARRAGRGAAARRRAARGCRPPHRCHGPRPPRLTRPEPAA